MSTYVFSDLHAQYNLWQQIKNFIKPDDLVFCLGDCVDRGPVGLEGLVSYKYKLYGNGDIVGDYSAGNKHFKHIRRDI